MKGELTLKILGSIGDAAVTTADVLAVVAGSSYGASYSQMDYALFQRQAKRVQRELLAEEELKRKERYYSMLYKLKRDGLIIQKINKQSKMLALTAKGKKLWSELRSRANNAPPAINYRKSPAVVFTIAAFDIPERHNGKRHWLRMALKHIGLAMIQKSVWIGKVKIPEEFIDDLRRLDLTECVEIFEITKAGTLRSVK
ncbi:MAG: hypothetical protein Q8Q41_04680 [bacterium]|nr:hypothetical protein [bacterium]